MIERTRRKPKGGTRKGTQKSRRGGRGGGGGTRLMVETGRELTPITLLYKIQDMNDEKRRTAWHSEGVESPQPKKRVGPKKKGNTKHKWSGKKKRVGPGNHSQ